jgi:hypothetical protein
MSHHKNLDVFVLFKLAILARDPRIAPISIDIG